MGMMSVRFYYSNGWSWCGIFRADSVAALVGAWLITYAKIEIEPVKQ